MTHSSKIGLKTIIALTLGTILAGSIIGGCAPSDAGMSAPAQSSSTSTKSDSDSTTAAAPAGSPTPIDFVNTPEQKEWAEHRAKNDN